MGTLLPVSENPLTVSHNSTPRGAFHMRVPFVHGRVLSPALPVWRVGRVRQHVSMVLGQAAASSCLPRLLMLGHPGQISASGSHRALLPVCKVSLPWSGPAIFPFTAAPVPALISAAYSEFWSLLFPRSLCEGEKRTSWSAPIDHGLA